MESSLPKNYLHIQFGKFKATATGRMAVAGMIIGLILLASVIGQFW